MRPAPARSRRPARAAPARRVPDQRAELRQEPARPPGPATRRAGCRVRQPQPLPGPGHPDVEQPALLLDLLRRSSRTSSAGCPRPARPGRPRPTPAPWPSAGRPASPRPPSARAAAAAAGPARRRSRRGRRSRAASPIGSTRACRVLLGELDQRGQRLPALPGGTAGRRLVAAPSRSPRSASRRRSAAASRRGSTGSAARSATIAWRISARSKNRSAPRTTYGTPASASAFSYASDWALVRNSTAISLGRRAGGDQLAGSARATAAASAGSSGKIRDVRLGAGRALPDQLQPQPRLGAAGLPDHRVGQPDDLRRRAVVADQPDHGRVAVPAGEVDQVRRGGAGERVDRLAGVADHGQVVAGRPATRRAAAAAAG